MPVVSSPMKSGWEWEGKREVDVLVAVEDAMEKAQMGIRTKNNWPQSGRKTILEPGDESGQKQTLPSRA